MKILFANRKDCFLVRGGDTVQMEKTKNFLEKLYSDVEIKNVFSLQEILNEKDAQIVHIFNMTISNETFEYIKAAKQSGKKIVLSPVFCNSVDSIYLTYMSFLGIFGLNLPLILKKIYIFLFNYLIILMSLFSERCKRYSKNGLYMFPRNKKLGRYILENSDIILPNSDTETDRIEKYYEYKIKNKSVIIPNATDFFSSPEGEEEINFYLPENFVLEVGRIEFMKNQINLIKALKDNSEIPIVLIGKNFNNKYNTLVKKYADKRGNVYIYDEIPHNKISAVYKKAKVHVLPSYIETTGLVSIEAKACGSQIVTSNEKHCPIKYYKFDELGFQCNPYNLKSIQKAVLEAYYKPKKIELNEEYKEFFSYENVAKMTHEVYLKVLEK